MSTTDGCGVEARLLDLPASVPEETSLYTSRALGLVLYAAFVASNSGKKRLRPVRVGLTSRGLAVYPKGGKGRGRRGDEAAVAEVAYEWRVIAKYGVRPEQNAVQLVASLPPAEDVILSFVLEDATVMEYMHEAVVHFVTQAYVAHVGGEGTGSGPASPALPGGGSSSSGGSGNSGGPDSKFATKPRIIDRFDELQLKLHHWALAQTAVEFMRVVTMSKVGLPRGAATPDVLDELAGQITELVRETGQAVAEHPMLTWTHPVEEIEEGLEMMAGLVLYPVVISDREALAKDKVLIKRVQAFKALQPEALGVPAGPLAELLGSDDVRRHSEYQSAHEALHRVNRERCPRLKVVAILDACVAVVRLIGEMSAGTDGVGADDMLPVLIYVIILSAPPLLHTNLRYIQRFRSRRALQGEHGYYTTQLWSAMTYLDNLSGSDVGMDRLEFASLLGVEVEGPAAPPLDERVCAQLVAAGNADDLGPQEVRRLYGQFLALWQAHNARRT